MTNATTDDKVLPMPTWKLKLGIIKDDFGEEVEEALTHSSKGEPYAILKAVEYEDGAQATFIVFSGDQFENWRKILEAVSIIIPPEMERTTNPPDPQSSQF